MRRRGLCGKQGLGWAHMLLAPAAVLLIGRYAAGGFGGGVAYAAGEMAFAVSDIHYTIGFPFTLSGLTFRIQPANPGGTVTAWFTYDTGGEGPRYSTGGEDPACSLQDGVARCTINEPIRAAVRLVVQVERASTGGGAGGSGGDGAGDGGATGSLTALPPPPLAGPGPTPEPPGPPEQLFVPPSRPYRRHLRRDGACPSPAGTTGLP